MHTHSILRTVHAIGCCCFPQPLPYSTLHSGLGKVICPYPTQPCAAALFM